MKSRSEPEFALLVASALMMGFGWCAERRTDGNNEDATKAGNDGHKRRNYKTCENKVEDQKEK